MVEVWKGPKIPWFSMIFARYLYSLEEEERETTHESLHADTCRYKSLNEIDSVMGRYIEAPHGFFRVPDRKSPRIVAIEPAGPLKSER